MKSIFSKYTIEEVNQEKWSYYWSKVSHHNLVQSWEYGEAKNTADTWIPIRFLVRDNKGNIKKKVPLIIRRAKPTFGYEKGHVVSVKFCNNFYKISLV